MHPFSVPEMVYEQFMESEETPHIKVIAFDTGCKVSAAVH
jgi:hypothetical protein